MFRKNPQVFIETKNLTMRLPQLIDRESWINLRRESADFLKPWEPIWQDDHLTRKSFSKRVEWAKKSVQNNSAVPLFIIVFTVQRIECLFLLTLSNKYQ